MKKDVWFLGITLLLIILSSTLVFALESGEVTVTNTSPHDKLSDILSRGRLVLVITQDLPAASKINDTERVPHTNCTDTQYTKNQVSGERIEIASRIAEELGVDACFVPADSDEIRNGSWDDKWDYFFGYYYTNERMKWLYFSQPLRASPSVFFIRSDNQNISSLKDLSEKTIGVQEKSTQGEYLKNTIDIHGDVTENPIINPKIVEYTSEPVMIDDLLTGKLDAVLIPELTMKSKRYNDTLVTQLDPYAFIGYSGPAVEKSNTTNPVPFVKKLNEIIQKLHKNGELSNLSMSYFHYDITKKAGEFDISSLNQFNES